MRDVRASRDKPYRRSVPSSRQTATVRTAPIVRGTDVVWRQGTHAADIRWVSFLLTVYFKQYVF